MNLDWPQMPSTLALLATIWEPAIIEVLECHRNQWVSLLDIYKTLVTKRSEQLSSEALPIVLIQIWLKNNALHRKLQFSHDAGHIDTFYMLDESRPPDTQEHREYV